jgi:hypothetical protein
MTFVDPIRHSGASRNLLFLPCCPKGSEILAIARMTAAGTAH